MTMERRTMLGRTLATFAAMLLPARLLGAERDGERNIAMAPNKMNPAGLWFDGEPDRTYPDGSEREVKLCTGDHSGAPYFRTLYRVAREDGPMRTRAGLPCHFVEAWQRYGEAPWLPTLESAIAVMTA